jgi:hypothetical protein
MSRPGSGRKREELVAEILANAGAFATRAETDPWTAELRQAKAEYESTGDYEHVARFVPRFKAHQARSLRSP